ncbi:MAG TPA: nucleotidyltransferase family protein [Nitrospiraceae bacterium]|nr:nucleotidyltransferase family protein [Nitrospiraceae bacterium]
MPSSTLDDLADAYTQVSLINKRLLDEYEIVGQAFQRQGIDCIVLKGADLLSRLYGMRGTRPLSDVDLLVHEQDLPAIHQLLIETGFTQQIDGNPAYYSSQSTLSLDLVSNLWYLDEEGLAALWARARIRPLGQLTVKQLCSDDLLLYLTAYSVVHRGRLSPSFFTDLRLLMEKEPLGWPTLIEEARRRHLKIPLYHGLRQLALSNSTIGIPATVIRQLSPSTKAEYILEFLFRRLVTTRPIPELGHFLLWITQPPGRRMPWLHRALLPPSLFLTYRYGNESMDRPWRTRITRWRQLAQAGSFLLTRMLIRVVVERPGRTIS